MNTLNKESVATKLSIVPSFAIFGSAALLMFLLTKYLIPLLSQHFGIENIVSWFLTAGLGVFTPLIITGIIILKSEGLSLTKNTWKERLRFRKINRHDFLLAITGLITAALLSGALLKCMEWFIGPVNHTPPFMRFERLSPERYWILLVWLPYWLLNIMGEEFLWRGVMLPGQEVAFGKYAWIIHGFGWGLFHFAFGWTMLITLVPLIFIQSYIVQKTRNSWVGVIMHGGLNGPAFLAIAFGLI